ncbi:gem-associated protein 7 isoform X2 [Clupea harengus]|uniref:Gem-associated protein 7 isoform X2 n=1 Tax=Clupea harengus TaxID=7950 RepID=A0A6P8FL90_CLUHA|nr:gem-associated protein 7 isoform X2 [Clupea harengus]
MHTVTNMMVEFSTACRQPVAMKKAPVTVLRLPRGPDPNSRGFDPNSPRFIALCPTSIPSSAGEGACIEEEQRSRSELRERFLRTLIKMSNKPVNFDMYEGVQVRAKFGASDIDVLNFQVSELQTPIGVQKEALLRCHDMISFSFDV